MDYLKLSVLSPQMNQLSTLILELLEQSRILFVAYLLFPHLMVYLFPQIGELSVLFLDFLLQRLNHTYFQILDFLFEGLLMVVHRDLLHHCLFYQLPQSFYLV